MYCKVFNEQALLKISEAHVALVVESVLFHEGKHYDEVAIHFIEEKAICELHEQFFHDPTPTDCISFPMDDDDEEGYKILGEVFISPKAALDYLPHDPYKELTLYLVHGLLHLLGYDDMEEDKESLMRQAESRHMQILEEKGSLLHAI